MRVKICGITSVDVGLAAIDEGVDLLGFVFVQNTRRYLTVFEASALIEGLRRARGHLPTLVGLFVDASLTEVRSSVQRCGVDAVQLCGQETPDFCRAVGVPVIRTIRPRVAGDLVRFDAFAPHVQRLTFDTFDRQLPGGSGIAGDWELARQIAERYPIILAGGLHAENVVAAIKAVQPWGVDTSSGVETNGKKDVGKIAAFVRAAKSA